MFQMLAMLFSWSSMSELLGMFNSVVGPTELNGTYSQVRVLVMELFVVYKNGCSLRWRKTTLPQETWSEELVSQLPSLVWFCMLHYLSDA